MKTLSFILLLFLLALAETAWKLIFGGYNE